MNNCPYPHMEESVWNGDEPACKGGQYMIDGEYYVADKWTYCHGAGESIGKNILMADININQHDSIFIYDKTLRVNHITQEATYFWCNDDSFSYSHAEGILGKRLPLEFDKAMKIINQLGKCKFEQMARNKIKEIIGE